MSHAYKLVFRGEVLEGQHPAVVRKRLGSTAGFADAQLDKLFSGQPIVVKRAADEATAARLQAMFKKAGARLHVLEDGDARADAADTAADSAAEAADDGAFTLLPAGSDLLSVDERTPWQPRDVDTGSLTLGDSHVAPAAAPMPAAPDVSHLELTPAGTDQSQTEAPASPRVAAPAFELGAVGEDLGQAKQSAAVPPNAGDGAFELAPAGETLDRRIRPSAPEAPDTSHLAIERDGETPD